MNSQTAPKTLDFLKKKKDQDKLLVHSVYYISL